MHIHANTVINHALLLAPGSEIVFLITTPNILSKAESSCILQSYPDTILQFFSCHGGPCSHFYINYFKNTNAMDYAK